MSQSRELAANMARIAADNRCRDVTVLDLRGISPVADFFVIATGTSSRQMKTVVAKMEEYVRGQAGTTLLGQEGMESQQWVLLDLVDVIVHVFAPDARSYYALELLWGDAPHVEWEAEPRGPTTKAGRRKRPGQDKA